MQESIETVKKRNANLRRYNFETRCHQNCIRFGDNEGLEHILKKVFIAIILHKGGDVDVLYPILKPYIEDFSNQIEVLKTIEEWTFGKNFRHFFLTEAKLDMPSNKGKDSIDIVDLDSGKEIEIDVKHGNVDELKAKKRRVL